MSFWTETPWPWGFVSKCKAPTVLAGIASVLLACSTVSERAEGLAKELGLSGQTVPSEPFYHRLYQRSHNSKDVLHIYLGGDGTPWIDGLFISDDPTPRDPLAMKLMASVEHNAIFVGRPCYFGLAAIEPCESVHWTHGRYGNEVLRSLKSVISTIRVFKQPIVLIGYSGGGALAVLLASELEGEVSVLTVAANLDTARWAEEHGYLPLDRSLNPIVESDLDGKFHLHLAGGKDQNVSRDHAIRFAQRHNGEYKVYPEFDHRCCWLNEWPSILSDFHESAGESRKIRTSGSMKHSASVFSDLSPQL